MSTGFPSASKRPEPAWLEVAWLEGGDVGERGPTPERRRRPASASEQHGLCTWVERAARSKRLGLWSGGWPHRRLRARALWTMRPCEAR
jgi:hypothetical protein